MNKQQAFTQLNTEFATDPSIFLDSAYELNCTRIGEFLIDHCQVDDEDAYEWAFEWAQIVETTL